MSNINPGSMDGSNRESRSFNLQLFVMQTDGTLTLVSYVPGQEPEDQKFKAGSRSEGSDAGSASTGGSPSSVARPLTSAAKEHVEEDPKLNITFQFVRRPKASTTVNAAPEIRMYCEEKGESRKVAFAHAILRAKEICWNNFIAYYPGEYPFGEQCKVSGRGVKGWEGLEGTYTSVCTTASYIKQVDGKK